MILTSPGVPKGGYRGFADHRPRWRQVLGRLMCRWRGHGKHAIDGRCLRCGKLIAMVYGGIA